MQEWAEAEVARLTELRAVGGERLLATRLELGELGVGDREEQLVFGGDPRNRTSGGARRRRAPGRV